MSSPANLGTLDRMIRAAAGLAAVWAVFYVDMGYSMQWGLTIFGLIMIVTGLCGYCPLYALLRISTYKGR